MGKKNTYEKDILRSLDLLSISFTPIFKIMTGSYSAGIVLSQIMYWHSVMNTAFYKTDDDFCSELLMSKKEFRTAKKRLKTCVSFLKITIKGVPAKTYYDIDYIAFGLAVQEAENSLPPYQKAINNKSKNKAKKGQTRMYQTGQTRMYQMGQTGVAQMVQTRMYQKGQTITETTTKNTSKTSSERETLSQSESKTPSKKISEKGVSEIIFDNSLQTIAELPEVLEFAKLWDKYFFKKKRTEKFEFTTRILNRLKFALKETPEIFEDLDKFFRNAILNYYEILVPGKLLVSKHVITSIYSGEFANKEVDNPNMRGIDMEEYTMEGFYDNL